MSPRARQQRGRAALRSRHALPPACPALAPQLLQSSRSVLLPSVRLTSGGGSLPQQTCNDRTLASDVTVCTQPLSCGGLEAHEVSVSRRASSAKVERSGPRDNSKLIPSYATPSRHSSGGFHPFLSFFAIHQCTGMRSRLREEWRTKMRSVRYVERRTHLP